MVSPATAVIVVALEPDPLPFSSELVIIYPVGAMTKTEYVPADTTWEYVPSGLRGTI